MIKLKVGEIVYRLGVDLGGTNIVVGIVDSNYQIISKISTKTNAGRSAEEIADSIAYITNKLIDEEKLNLSDFSSFGIGSPGAIDSMNGVVLSAGNLGFKNVPLKQLLKERMGVDFYIENDADVAAFGEYIAGAGKSVKSFILITLGTGVGSGIIIDGKIFKGSNFSGGELGHIIMDMNGEKCVCGTKGCFETYASASALVKQTKAEMLNNKNSLMWEIAEDVNKVNGITAFKAAKMGDPTATLVVDKYTEYIALGIINIIRSFGPEMVCMGGGISNEKDNLLLPVKEHILKYNNEHSFLNKTKISIAELKNDAGIIGAAFLDTLAN